MAVSERVVIGDVKAMPVSLDETRLQTVVARISEVRRLNDVFELWTTVRVNKDGVIRPNAIIMGLRRLEVLDYRKCIEWRTTGGATAKDRRAVVADKSDCGVGTRISTTQRQRVDRGSLRC